MRRNAFTLAEVLITLGIIGVVAAMTIPTLIANTNGAKFRSQFKKTLSTLNQAGLMAQAQYDFDYSGAGVCSGTGDTDSPTAATGMTFCGLLNGTLTGYSYVNDPFAVTSGEGESATKTDGLKRGDADYEITGDYKSLDYSGGKYHAYQLADGSLVAFQKGAKECTVPIGQQLTKAALTATKGGDGTDKNDAVGLALCVGFIDVNGVTLPNKEVSCNNSSDKGLDVGTCEVPNDAAHMTDVFPIVFHDATVEPATKAARYVLTTSK